MSNESDPIVDNWYIHLDKGQRFFVVAVDDNQGLVEIQHFDGDVEEMSFAEWSDLNIEVGEAPENWSGATDMGEMDDYGTEVTDTVNADWNDPLKQFNKPEG